MLILFYIIAALMCAVALILLLFPLFKTAPELEESSQNKVNVEIYKEKLIELEKAQLAEDVFKQAKLLLDKNLAQDLQTTRENKPVNRGIVFASNTLILLLIPVIAIGVYSRYGSPDLLNVTRTEEQIKAAEQLAQIQVQAQQLRQKLQENPKDGISWVFLARAYTMLEKFKEAQNAYEQALHYFQPPEPELMLEVAEFFMSINQGNLVPEAEALVEKALVLNPNAQKALFFGGITAYKKQDYGRAAALWTHLLALIPTSETEVIATLNKQIAQAKQLGNLSDEQVTTLVNALATPSSTTETIVANTAAAIQVTVNLAPELKEKVQATDTLFVYAKATKGMPMPVAIVRLTGEQLLNTNSPLTVTLDDSTAAMPTMRLSSLEQVNVVARISSKGQAMPQSGDLMGEQTAVNTRNDEKVTIEINKILP